VTSRRPELAELSQLLLSLRQPAGAHA